MRNNFVEQFGELRRSDSVAFMPFIVAGDPDFKTSLKIIKTLARHSDFLELGFPYSDPLADGPVIQKADMRALKAKITPPRVFDLIREIRKESNIPITVLCYANLVYQMGIDEFYRAARRVGIQGVLVPDVPFEEAGPFVTAANENHVNPIFLVAQTTDLSRLRRILTVAEGYLYLVSVLGVTGERKVFPKETLKFIRNIRNHTKSFLAVGFGISTPEQVAELKATGVDGVIVGSAIEKIVERNLGHEKKMIKEIISYVTAMKTGIRS